MTISSEQECQRNTASFTPSVLQSLAMVSTSGTYCFIVLIYLFLKSSVYISTYLTRSRDAVFLCLSGMFASVRNSFKTGDGDESTGAINNYGQ